MTSAGIEFPDAGLLGEQRKTSFTRGVRLAQQLILVEREAVVHLERHAHDVRALNARRDGVHAERVGGRDRDGILTRAAEAADQQIDRLVAATTYQYLIGFAPRRARQAASPPARAVAAPG